MNAKSPKDEESTVLKLDRSDQETSTKYCLFQRPRDVSTSLGGTCAYQESGSQTSVTNASEKTVAYYVDLFGFGWRWTWGG
jgi:hypothetical protein